MSIYPDWLGLALGGEPSTGTTTVLYAADRIAVFAMEAERLSFKSTPGHLRFDCAPETIHFSVTHSLEFSPDATATTAFRSTP